jgi:hypothetical protein
LVRKTLFFLFWLNNIIVFWKNQVIFIIFY